MKCAICNKKTDWDSSYGYEEFIVCPHCFEKLRAVDGDVLDLIFACGQIRKERKEQGKLK